MGALGTYTQAPEPADLSAVFGHPKLRPSRAVHATLGFSVEFSAFVGLELLGYEKELIDLAVRGVSASPPVAAVLESTGRGQVYGTQTLLWLRRWRGFSGSLAWTMSRSLRQGPGDGAPRRSDYDQPHVLALTLERAFGLWLAGLRARLASGAPRTPVTGSYRNLSSGAYEPIFGALDSTRLPAFFQLDARVERSFELASGGRLSFALEVLNLTAHEQAEEFLYSESYAPAGYLLGLPPLLNVAVRFEQ